MPADATEAKLLADAITQGGAILVLVFIVILFLRGDIYTKTMLDRTFTMFNAQWAKTLEEAMTRALTTARAQWQAEVLELVRKTNSKLDDLPCVSEKQHRRKSDKPVAVPELEE